MNWYARTMASRTGGKRFKSAATAQQCVTDAVAVVRPERHTGVHHMQTTTTVGGWHDVRPSHMACTANAVSHSCDPL